MPKDIWKSAIGRKSKMESLNGLDMKEWNTAVNEAKSYYDAGHKYAEGWMQEYVAQQAAIAKLPRCRCHDCFERIAPNLADGTPDKLFKCSTEGCRTRTHHAYSCSKGPIEGREYPSDHKMEKHWICWMCVFREESKKAAQRRANIEEAALRRYWKTVDAQQLEKGAKNTKETKASVTSKKTKGQTQKKGTCDQDVMP